MKIYEGMGHEAAPQSWYDVEIPRFYDILKGNN